MDREGEMNKDTDDGLSLIEVLLALAIMAIVLYSLGGGFDNASSVNVTTVNRTSAMQDARKIVEHVRMMAEEQGLSAVTNSSYWTNWFANTDFDLNNATRQVSFPDGTTADPLRVRVTVSWPEKGGSKQYSLETLVTKRL